MISLAQNVMRNLFKQNYALLSLCYLLTVICWCSCQL